MKKLLLLLFALLVLLSVKGQNEKNSKIIFIRQYNYAGGAIDFKVNVNDTILRVRNNSYFTYNCLPGEYQLLIKKNGAKPFKLLVESGKMYYIHLGVNQGFWSAKSYMVVIDSVSANNLIKEDKLKDAKDPADWIRPKHRIGINMDAGGGFNDIPFATTTDGKDVSLSFGKDFMIGLRYAYQFKKHFEYALDLSYENSSLKPHIDNGKVNFNRTVLSATPFYILPIRDGYFMRLKFGAGLDYYLNPKLNIKMSGISDGINDTWSYKDALGYHVATIFELYTGKNFSIDYGMKWTEVNYLYKPTQTKYEPTSNDLIKPKGGSISCTIGFYYNF